MKWGNKTWIGVIGCILLTMIMVAGCGSKIKPPHDVISNAEMAINRAIEADALSYAPLDIRYAQEKIAKAKEFMAKGNHEEAYQMAEDAILDAQVAEAVTRAEKSKELSQKMQNNIDSLRKEIDRTQ
jgi:hypothetical protein